MHPGDILREDFLAPMAISQYRLAGALGVPAQRYFGTEAQFWMNRQSHYELEVADDTLQRRIEAEVRPLVA